MQMEEIKEDQNAENMHAPDLINKLLASKDE